MDLSKIQEIVALTIEKLKFTWIEAEDILSFFFFLFFFFSKQRKRETTLNHHNVIDFKVFRTVQVILSAHQSLKTTFDKTSASNESVCIPN